MLEPGKKPEGFEAKAKDWDGADFDYEPDEKHKTVAITERGVEKAEKFLGIENLYLAENGNLVNHLIQALKAESLYKRDVDYAVIDGEVKIIDEFTGRILEGRRWSEGLHQAVEAKEGVAIQEENQTVATITYQNYFRRYDKLAGMTGTALTEATEFMKIYELQVVEIPTNRADGPRRTRTTRSTRPRTASGRPSPREIAGAPRRAASRCSSGTISVEVSELLSARAEEERHPAHGAEREARARRARGRDRSPRPASPARSRSRPTWPAAASTSSSAATPSTSPQLELRERGLEPGTDELGQGLGRDLPGHRGARSRRTARRSWRPAACSSSAPSATSRAGSTTSCAAAPAARATPASRASTSPPRTTSCACSPATASTASSTASARSDEEGEEEPIEAEDALASRSRAPRRRSRSRTS